MNRLLMKLVVVFGLVALFSAAASADFYEETKLPALLGGDKKPKKTWISGLKQREEIWIPMTGDQVIIDRLDKGVQWILFPADKKYEEKPIALTYNPALEKFLQGSSRDKDGTPSPAEKKDKEGAISEIRKLPDANMIAGYETMGYETRWSGKTGPEGLILWIAPLSPALEQLEKERVDFETEHHKMLYANYPPDKQKEHLEGMKFFGTKMAKSMGAFLGSMNGLGGFPKGIPLAMERVMPTGQHLTIYEVTALATTPADPALFEFPPDYMKVDQDTFVPGPMGAFTKEMRKMQKNMDAQDPIDLQKDPNGGLQQMQQMMNQMNHVTPEMQKAMDQMKQEMPEMNVTGQKGTENSYGINDSTGGLSEEQEKK